VKPFTFVRAESVSDAVAALRDHGDGARVLAGGQSLLLAMKDRLRTPRVLVSVGRVAELRGVRGANGTVEIGAATTYAELERAELAGAAALLPRVAADVADAPVRRMGTIGGALCQADPQFDVPVAAVALGAEVELASARGRRTLPVADFLRGRLVTACAPDELLTRIRVPTGGARTGGAFEKFTLRRFEAAIASVACIVRVDDAGSVVEARIACGGIADAPLRLPASERAVVGARIGERRATEAGRLAADVAPTFANPLWSAAYRRRLLGTLVGRALVRACAAAGAR
jgi:carbon-monoxide dehydrogenase medium subunit